MSEPSEPRHYTRTQGAVEFKSGIDAHWGLSFYSRDGKRDPYTNELYKGSGVNSASSMSASRFACVASGRDGRTLQCRAQEGARAHSDAAAPPPPPVRRRRAEKDEPRAAKRPRRAAHEPVREGRPPGLTELVRDVPQAADKDEPSDRRWHRLVVRMLGEARETTTADRLRALPALARAGVIWRLKKGKLYWDVFNEPVRVPIDANPSLERAVFNPHLERKKAWNALQGSDELLDPGRAEIQRLQYRVAEAARHERCAQRAERKLPWRVSQAKGREGSSCQGAAKTKREAARDVGRRRQAHAAARREAAQGADQRRRVRAAARHQAAHSLARRRVL